MYGSLCGRYARVLFPAACVRKIKGCRPPSFSPLPPPLVFAPRSSAAANRPPPSLRSPSPPAPSAPFHPRNHVSVPLAPHIFFLLSFRAARQLSSPVNFIRASVHYASLGSFSFSFPSFRPPPLPLRFHLVSRGTRDFLRREFISLRIITVGTKIAL